MRNRRQIHGFTLIELLVVVSIIALLVSILMPALGRARKQARTTVCLTNMKTFGTAFAVYASAFNDNFFPGTIINDSYWQQALESSYGKVREALLCPEAKTFSEAPGGTSPNDIYGHPWGAAFFCWGSGKNLSMIGTYQSSYGLNNYFNGDCDDIAINKLPVNTQPNARLRRDMYRASDKNPEKYWKKMSRVRPPGDVGMMVDSTVFAFNPSNSPSAASTGSTGSVPPFDGPDITYESIVGQWVFTGGWGMRTIAINRHSVAVNVLYADAHAKTVPLNELWDIKWAMNSGIPDQAKRDFLWTYFSDATMWKK